MSQQTKPTMALVQRIRDGHHPKLDGQMFGAPLADVFRTPAYDCRALGSDYSASNRACQRTPLPDQ
jgi:hypothetical protein